MLAGKPPKKPILKYANTQNVAQPKRVSFQQNSVRETSSGLERSKSLRATIYQNFLQDQEEFTKLKELLILRNSQSAGTVLEPNHHSSDSSPDMTDSKLDSHLNEFEGSRSAPFDGKENDSRHINQSPERSSYENHPQNVVDENSYEKEHPSIRRSQDNGAGHLSMDLTNSSRLSVPKINERYGPKESPDSKASFKSPSVNTSPNKEEPSVDHENLGTAQFGGNNYRREIFSQKPKEVTGRKRLASESGNQMYQNELNNSKHKDQRRLRSMQEIDRTKLDQASPDQDTDLKASTSENQVQIDRPNVELLMRSGETMNYYMSPNREQDFANKIHHAGSRSLDHKKDQEQSERLSNNERHSVRSYKEDDHRQQGNESVLGHEDLNRSKRSQNLTPHKDSARKGSDISHRSILQESAGREKEDKEQRSMLSHQENDHRQQGDGSVVVPEDLNRSKRSQNLTPHKDSARKGSDISQKSILQERVGREEEDIIQYLASKNNVDETPNREKRPNIRSWLENKSYVPKSEVLDRDLRRSDQDFQTRSYGTLPIEDLEGDLARLRDLKFSQFFSKDGSKEYDLVNIKTLKSSPGPHVNFDEIDSLQKINDESLDREKKERETQEDLDQQEREGQEKENQEYLDQQERERQERELQEELELQERVSREKMIRKLDSAIRMETTLNRISMEREHEGLIQSFGYMKENYLEQIARESLVKEGLQKFEAGPINRRLLADGFEGLKQHSNEIDQYLAAEEFSQKSVLNNCLLALRNYALYVRRKGLKKARAREHFRHQTLSKGFQKLQQNTSFNKEFTKHVRQELQTFRLGNILETWRAFARKEKITRLTEELIQEKQHKLKRRVMDLWKQETVTDLLIPLEKGKKMRKVRQMRRAWWGLKLRVASQRKIKENNMKAYMHLMDKLMQKYFKALVPKYMREQKRKINVEEFDDYIPLRISIKDKVTKVSTKEKDWALLNNEKRVVIDIIRSKDK